MKGTPSRAAASRPSVVFPFPLAEAAMTMRVRNADRVMRIRLLLGASTI